MQGAQAGSHSLDQFLFLFLFIVEEVFVEGELGLERFYVTVGLLFERLEHFNLLVEGLHDCSVPVELLRLLLQFVLAILQGFPELLGFSLVRRNQLLVHFHELELVLLQGVVRLSQQLLAFLLGLRAVVALG